MQSSADFTLSYPWVCVTSITPAHGGNQTSKAMQTLKLVLMHDIESTRSFPLLPTPGRLPQHSSRACSNVQVLNMKHAIEEHQASSCIMTSPASGRQPFLYSWGYAVITACEGLRGEVVIGVDAGICSNLHRPSSCTASQSHTSMV